MKLVIGMTVYMSKEVAPFTGAWIETPMSTNSRTILLVAPFTGAWIETSMISSDGILIIVAPFTGAWIETTRAVTRLSI